MSLKISFEAWEKNYHRLYEKHGLGKSPRTIEQLQDLYDRGVYSKDAAFYDAMPDNQLTETEEDELTEDNYVKVLNDLISSLEAHRNTYDAPDEEVSGISSWHRACENTWQKVEENLKKVRELNGR